MVYEQIIQAQGVPVASSLRECKGMLLSCRGIYAEFEFEAMKVLHAFLGRAQKKWRVPNLPLRLPTPTTLSETANLEFGIPNDLHIREALFIASLVEDQVYYLAKHLHNFTLKTQYHTRWETYWRRSLCTKRPWKQIHVSVHDKVLYIEYDGGEFITGKKKGRQDGKNTFVPVALYQALKKRRWSP